MSMQDVNIPTLPEMDVSLEIVTNSTFWGNIEGDITDQTDLIDLIDTKIDIEATARENNDLALQNGINTLNDNLTAEISNRGTADGILQDNIDTLSDTVTNNYNALDSAITSEATTRANADTTLQSNIDTLSSTVTSNYNTLNGAITSEQTERENADNTLQDNIDTLSGTVTSNYNTLDGKIGDNKTAIDNHIADKTNPHEVTKSQVGLGNVDNTSDLNKPISTATQNALDGKVPTSRTVNSKALTSDITLTASDVDALPDTTTINDLTTAEQQSALNSGANSTNIGQIATNTQAISTEATNRQNADNNLQSQIDALVVASDVFDIVGTYAELQAYDISTVPVNDIIKVLVDSTHNNAATYYRCVENDNVKSWSYIGAEGAYYTKSEADGRFVEQTTTINGQALSNNITLDAEDVGALPDSTTIGNGTLTIQKNGSTIDSFGANDTGNTTVNITVPTDTGDLTNNAGFITGINSTDVTTALGYTPYDSSNPNGYTSNVGTVTKVNNTSPDSNGNVTISIPDAQIQSNWTETSSSSKAYIQNKPNLATVATSGSYNDLTNKPTIPPAVTVDSALSSTSTNPVQNKVINSALSDKYDASNPDGYITGITSTDISDALGYTPPNYFTGSNILINPVEKVTLPSGYTQVSYIEGTGSQYIDTGWNFSNTYPVKIDCKFIVKSYSGGSGGYPTVYGLQTSAYTNWIYPFYINAGNFSPHIGGSASIDSVPCALGQLYDTSFTISSGTWSRTINGIDTSGTWTGTITTGANMFLFGGSYGANPINQLIGKIFSFKITVNNSVVRNYVPCKRNSDNVAGMYDLVTNTFKPSASGSFLMGEEVTASGDMISAIVPTNNNQLVNGAGYITNSAITNMQTTTNLVTSLSASSTDTQYPSAKCVYDIVGDIETALNTINSGV